MSRSQHPRTHPLPVAPHLVLQAARPLLPVVSDPAYRWLSAVLLWNTAGALGCSQAGPQCLCWASASGGREAEKGSVWPRVPASSEQGEGCLARSAVAASWQVVGGSPRGRAPSSLAPPSPQQFLSRYVPCSRAGQCLSAAKRVGRHRDVVLAAGSAGVLVCLLAGQV